MDGRDKLGYDEICVTVHDYTTLALHTAKQREEIVRSRHSDFIFAQAS